MLFEQCMKIDGKYYKKKIVISRLKIKISKKAHLNTDNILTFNFDIIGQFTVILKLTNDTKLVLLKENLLFLVLYNMFVRRDNTCGHVDVVSIKV